MSGPLEISIDIETRSLVSLPQVGVHVYADAPSTGIWCMAWAPPGQPVNLWREGDAWPEQITDHYLDGGRLRAWNAGFERTVMGVCGVRRYGFPSWLLNPETWVCSMAEAAAMALPQALARCAPAVHLPLAKDTVGARVMMQLCQARPSDGRLWTKEDVGAQAKLRTLYDYCIQDVEVERGIAARLVRLKATQRELWLLTERMNDRGVYIDRELCDAAQKIVDRAVLGLTSEMRSATDYTVAGPTAVAQIKTWLREQGVAVEGLDKSVIEHLLMSDNLTPKVRRVLEIRQAAAKSSTSKLLTMVRRQSKDGTAKGMFRFHGAGTGRYSVGGLQLQNFPRADPSLDVDAVIADVLAGDYDMLQAMHGSPMHAVSSALRGCLIAAPGEELVSADESQIEMRMNAWLSGQDDAVDGFRAYDRKEGPDAYVVAAAGIYGIPLSAVSKSLHRPVGKVACLSLGFIGGAGALLKMARANGVDLAGVAGSVLEAASAANVILADKAWTDRGVQTGTAEQRWKTAELIKLAWRDANPDIVRYSKALEMTAREAVRAPGAWLSVRDRLWSEYPGCGQRVPDVVHYRKSGSFLQCRLPSGRLIYYPDARLGAAATPWGEMRATVIAKTEDLNSRWVDRPLNPGLLIENVVQAASCDVMTDAMRRVDRERPDMKIRLTIHDEIVASVALGVDALQDLCDILATPVAWAPGLPLAAAGWAGKRFRKE